MDDSLFSGVIESSSVMAPQETLRQSLLPSASQRSASDAQLFMLLSGSRCPPQLTNVDKLPHPGQAGDGSPPQLTNVDEPSHSRQESSVAHNRKILKKSAAQVVQEHRSVANVGSYFGSQTCPAQFLWG